MKHPEKKFLKRPEYPGGKEAFRQYVKEHLVYPEEAREKRIEGIVYLHAEIDDNGTVRDVEVEKGIGGGCDEEAVRLIRNVRFGKVKNRGVRLKTRQKFRIQFKLPVRQKTSGTTVPRKITYQLSQSKGSQSTAATKEAAAPKQENKKYTYTIRLNAGEQ
jgi:TonB family protein